MSLIANLQKNGSSVFQNRIAPITENRWSLETRKKLFTDRIFITRMFYFVALVFPLKPQETSRNKLCRRLLENGSTLLLSLYIIGDLKNLFYLVWKLPMGLIFSSLFTDIFSITIRLTLLFKRQAILSAMVHLQDTFPRLQPTKFVSQRLHMIIGLCGSCIIPIAFFWFTADLCSQGSEALLKVYVEDTFFGWSAENKWVSCVIFVTVDLLVVNQQYILFEFLLILSWYLLNLLKQTVESFVTEAVQEQDMESLFESYIRYSRIISKCMSMVEEALSMLLLVLYGFMVFSIFSVTTYLMTADLSVLPAMMVVPKLILFFVMMAGFYIVSFQAVAVHEVAIKVKHTIHELVSVSDSSDFGMKCLLLTLATDFPSKVVVTCWGLFSVKRSFLQKTASGMFTYAILLSQLGNQTRH
ncbi:uncharacterized protein NPIL_245271 [Nephila pilipes]|uniref:Uncharacterized protein n=1 Tax=Nephila pilipes TaxID=299642 RepID=A0A8X6NTQ1_NEPPI|nr:uncharacterized protein NPIL_245271 [Nephila pilipes]